MKQFYKKQPIIGVIGSGLESAYENKAYKMGKFIAKSGCILLTGGGDGIMKAASKGAFEEGGLVIGILPSDGPDDLRYSKRYPNEYVHIPIYTGMSDARNSINIKSSSIIVAFPGGGTLSEIGLAVKNKKPIVVIGWESFGMDDYGRGSRVYHAEDVDVAKEIVERLLSELEG
ncbi:hypothetical protein SAMN02745945_00031 [Peptoclostridium litorale DSM 5388]|uniref:TIGR00725 family protein n=1 Tax=Peptoclostridium litorale DSM 5388 TaxID=1121324 RepID=A0A069RI92_PEPLI|nr:LOG family protein [Peptoclostridium litorale]KDR96716.1 hypothetical protein CLIT_2c03220 [Peptoclostridium litorale DSM 5388]SIN67473.1 hypothetical protein SAMN02745945_00031 [Peptoclostridium litorale DSM 5388]